jgi:hypothetical protein
MYIRLLTLICGLLDNKVKASVNMIPKALGPRSKGRKKPNFTDKLYEKSEKLQDRADTAASKGKYKKASRLENRVARVEERENKKRAKYNY